MLISLCHLYVLRASDRRLSPHSNLFYNLSMKKDFSQDFEFTKLYADIIVRDVMSKKYLVLGSTAEHEEDFFSTLTLTFNSADQITRQLAEYLYSESLVLNSYRELARRVDASFSFADETPGSEAINVCLIVEVDALDISKFSKDDTEPLMVDVYELFEKLSASPYYGITTDLGIAQLISEDKILHG
jgi:hypothetical protein